MIYILIDLKTYLCALKFPLCPGERYAVGLFREYRKYSYRSIINLLHFSGAAEELYAANEFGYRRNRQSIDKL